MTDAATECLPPDPATPGLWWLSTPAAPVMRAWQPASHAWADTDGGRTAACSAHAAGWHVLAAAVPPGPISTAIPEPAVRRAWANRTGARSICPISPGAPPPEDAP